MGRLTQVIEYINAEPKKINELKDMMTHISVTPELKKIRKHVRSNNKKR